MPHLHGFLVYFTGDGEYASSAISSTFFLPHTNYDFGETG